MLKNREKYNIIVKGGSEIMGKMKYKYNMKKIIICGMLLLIIMCIPKNIFGAEVIIDLKEEPEMYDTIQTILDKYNDPENEDRTEQGLARIIQEVCGNDSEKIKKLQYTYTYNGGGMWNGIEGIHASATDIAIKSNQNGTEIKPGTQGAKEQLLKEISELADRTVYSKNASLEDLELLEEKLALYNENHGIGKDSAILRDIANKVRAKLQEYGRTEPTVADEIEERIEEREEYEEEYSSETTSGLLGSPTVSTSHTLAEIIKEARRIFRKRYWKIEF